MIRHLLWTSYAFVLGSASLSAQSVIPGPHHTPVWRELGPKPIGSSIYAGRISAVACSPSDPERLFVAGADGGVWRTTNGGVSWQPLTGELSTTAIGALALAADDEDTIFVGTGEANYANHSRYGLGVLRSEDGGESWEEFAPATFGGRCFSALGVDPGDPDVLFGAVTRAGGFPELAAAKAHPGASGALGVFKSSDRGVSWARLANSPDVSTTSLVIDPTNASRLYAGVGRIFGGAQNGVWRSLDGGATWSKLAGGLPTSQIGRVTVALAPSLPSRLYVLITRPSDASGGGASTLGAWRSDDGGDTWNSLPVPSLQATYGWYLSVVSVRPSDPDTVFMGGLSLQRSTNGGATWSTVTPPHVDMHALAWDASGRLIAGDDGGVHRSTNLGNSWTSLNQGLGTAQFYAGLSSHPTNNQLFLGGLQDNGSVRRDTASTAWAQVFGGDGGWTQINPTTPSVAFVEFQGTGNLYKSTDGGNTFFWSGSGINGADRNCFLPPFVIDPNDATRMLYGTQRVYRSTNGGDNWTAISGDLSAGSGAIRALAVSPVDSQVVWVVTNDHRVLISTDGGSSFSLRLSGAAGWPRVTREITPHPTERNTAYLAGATFGTAQVRRTLDLGQSWTALDGGLPDVPVNVLAVDPGPTDKLYAGTDQGVWWTGDEGLNWRPYGEGLPRVPVIDLSLQVERRRLVAASQGRGAWVVELEAMRHAR
jgi:photosystem II stability/assembly factor-like uncharacterized protein